MYVKSKTWQEVQDFYSNCALENTYFQPLVDFVTLIADSIYASGLYPTTSMHSLLLTQTESFEFGHQVLQIELNDTGTRFSFKYLERSFVRPRFVKESSVEEAFGTLEHFLRLNKWFLKSPMKVLELERV
jgi:hypothetical protein